MALENEFESLLKYLEKEKTKKKKINSKKISQPKKKTGKSPKKEERNKIDEYKDIPSFLPMSKTNLSIGFDVKKFESLMRAKLIDEHIRRDGWDRPNLWVTELIYCLRKSYYSRKKYKVEVSKLYNFSYLSLIQAVGNEVHKFIQKIYAFDNVEKKIVSKTYGVTGKADAIRDNFVLDFKTIDENKFTGSYKKEDYYQGLIYAYILNTEYNYSIDTITIVYILRNLKNVYSFDLPVDNKKGKSLLQNALLLHKCLNDNKVPDIIGSTEEQCRFCPYITYCDGDGKNNKLGKVEIDKKDETIFLM